MNIDLLLKAFRITVRNYTFKNMDFFKAINSVSDFIMYEQSIIKKDNLSGSKCNITYHYDKLSYDTINDFISSIKFIDAPIIGAQKNVILKDINYSSDLEKNIYLMDKIKDSFMHLENNETKFYFIDDYNKILIDNQLRDYSLKCIISRDELEKFNSIIRDNYYEVDPEILWVHNLSKRTKNMNINSVNCHKLKKENLYVYRVPGNDRIIFSKKSPQKIYTEHYKKSTFQFESDYLSYHTYSYLTLLRATSNHEYPMLNELYNLNFNCQHPEYIQKCNKIIKNMISFYQSFSSNSNIPYEKVQLFLSNHLSNLTKEFNQVNNYLLTYMRNARSHANKIGDSDFNITYYDVKYNSLLLNTNDLSTPTFLLTDTNSNMNRLFDRLNYYDYSIDDLNNKINNAIINNVDCNELDQFLNQIYFFILQCDKDKMEVSKLLTPVGNASNFVDFMRKILDNTYEYPAIEDSISSRKKA